MQEYVAEASRVVMEQTGLLPHVNAGVLCRSDFQALKAVSGEQPPLNGQPVLLPSLCAATAGVLCPASSLFTGLPTPSHCCGCSSLLGSSSVVCCVGSQGLMLEATSERLMQPGMPHFNCPDKVRIAPKDWQKTLPLFPVACKSIEPSHGSQRNIDPTAFGISFCDL